MEIATSTAASSSGVIERALQEGRPQNSENPAVEEERGDGSIIDSTTISAEGLALSQTVNPGGEAAAPPDNEQQSQSQSSPSSQDSNENIPRFLDISA